MGKLLNFKAVLAMTFFALALVGCSGEDAFNGGGSSTSGATGSGTVASVLLLTSSPSMGTASSSEVTLTAQVKDSNNNLLEGESVIFSANGGALTVDSATTNASGIATARLSPTGDPSNRTITVTALAGTQSTSVSIAASGTGISISGESSVVLNDTATLTVSLADSKGTGIPGQLLTITSANGNPISATSLSTDSSGNVAITVTGQTAGSDTITVTALNGSVSQTHTLTVSGDDFTVALPSAELAIGSAHTVTATWNVSGAPAADGQTVNFSSTRGTLSASSAMTSGGTASVTVSSTTAGPVAVTASVSGGPTASATAEFIATTPSTLTAQAESDTMGPNSQQNTITAVVRDAAGNFVKNVPIRFTIEQDTSGGSISNATAVTDSLGRATTVYTSTAATTAKDGVVIRSEIEGTPAINDSVAITVGQSELFVVLGTGDKIITLPDEIRYQKKYVVLVTDSGGNPTENATVTASLIPLTYRKGARVSEDFDATTGDPLGPFIIPPAATTCINEDLLVPATALNGVLDAGEDLNGNGTLEPRNVASVTASTTTDATGFATIDVTYAKDFGGWTKVRLQASAQVAGSEGSDQVDFTLSVAAADIKTVGVAHPGDISPFGTVSDCTNPN